MNRTMNRLASMYLDGVANTLFKAHKGMRSVVVDEKEMNTQMAYSIQDSVLKKLSYDSDNLAVGYRVALTNQKIQSQFGAQNPIYGTLINSNVTNGIVIYDHFLEPYILAGLMFLINEDISPNADIEEILQKTSVAPGIEVIDSRIKNWYGNVSIGEIIADNCVSGKVVIGNQINIDSAQSLRDLEVLLCRENEVVALGESNLVMNSPINSVKWLISELAISGKFLKKGMIVSSGSFLVPKPLYRGVYKADFKHFGTVCLKVR